MDNAKVVDERVHHFSCWAPQSLWKGEYHANTFLKNRNVLALLACLLAIILIYSTDLYKLTYRLQRWKRFGETLVAVSQVQYFVADTPDLIGFQEIETGNPVTCGTTIAYVKSAGSEVA